VAKSADAFRTISEAAEQVGAPQHVLRFWETKFDFVTPVKRAGGRRFYRPQDIAVLKAVKSAYEQDLLARDAYVGVSSCLVIICTLMRVLWQFSSRGRAGAPFPPDRYVNTIGSFSQTYTSRVAEF